MSLASASHGTVPGIGAVTERVRERLRAESADPARDPERARQLAVAEIRRHNDFALARGWELIDDEEASARTVLAAVAGFGPLQQLLDDPEIEEIWLNAPDRVFYAKAGRSHRAAIVLTADAVRDLVERMLQSTGRRVDLSQPFVDASLPDGSRLHVVIPDVTRSAWAINIRKFLATHRSLDDLVRAGSLSEAGASLLTDAMAAGSSVLVSGATQAGNTTWNL